MEINFSVKAKTTLLIQWTSLNQSYTESYTGYVTTSTNISPQVLLFKNGEPILRVERGTTLSVIKLLYQADPRNKGTVIALRPDTDDPLPCVLTQDQSPLEEAKYEIITYGKYTWP